MITHLLVLLTTTRFRRPALLLAVGVTLLLASGHFARGQVTITEINPNQSTLDPNDPDGASGGRVNGLAVVPGSNQIFYAASEWGGLYRSTDAGRTWARLNGSKPTVMWDVEVSPGEPTRVIATSFYDGRVASRSGINVSTDKGLTWTRPASATPPAGFCREVARRDEPSAFGISFNRANPRQVFVGTNCGVAVSNDSGATWRFVDPTPNDGADDVWDVVVHHGGIVDACGDDGHSRSTDGGATWTTATGTPLPSGRCSIAASPDEAHVLFAVVAESVFESDDGGLSWNTQFVNPSSQGRIPFVATNQRSGAAFDLWFGDISLFRAGCVTPSPANPGGSPRCPPSNTWAGPFTRSAGGHDDTGDILFDARTTVGTPPPPNCLQECQSLREDCLREVGRPGGPLAAQCVQQFNRCRERCNSQPTPVADPCPLLFSSDGGVYFNTRTTSPDCHTPAWEQPNVTPHGLWLFGMAGAPRAGATGEDLYFGNQDNGSFGTTTAGASAPTWTNRDCCDGFDDSASTTRVLYTICCFNPPPANRLMMRDPGLAGGGFVPTASLPPGNLPGFRFIDIIDRFGPQHYVLMTTNGVFVTTNVTASPIVWTQLGAASTPAGACGVRAAGTTANPTFFVEAGSCSGSTQDRLFRFTGTGPAGTWQQVPPPGNVGGFGIFSVDPGNPARLFASHINGNTVRLVLSSDGGANWAVNASLNNLMTGGGAFRMRTQRGPSTFTGFNGYVQPTLVAHDPFDPNILVAGGADSGIFLSRNNGASWTVVTDNSGTDSMPHIPRPRFAYFSHEECRVNIFVGTQGRGVWRLSFTTQPTAAQREACLAECQTERADCMAEVGRPGGPLASQCVQRFNQCRARCQSSCPP